MTIPYSGSRSGAKAREEISKILRGFGCESVGFMDHHHNHELLLAFTHRGRNIQLKASAKGWANAFLKENPWRSTRTTKREVYEQKALDQGIIAINSILRDWVKGQVTAIECGILSFDQVFMPYMLLPDGQTFLELAQSKDLIPKQKLIEV